MKDYLEYYYNINIINYYAINNNYLILDNYDNTYYLYQYDKELININYILNIIRKININNTFYYPIIYDKYNNIINKYSDKEYILLKVKGLINTNINIVDMLNNNKLLKVNNKPIDLEKLWSNKIDYLEYQVSQLAKDKKELIDSFSYFIGLAENAISLLNINNINYKNASISIVHNRIKYPNNTIDYYNTLNIMIDYSTRDLAEYIKDKLYNKLDVSKDIDYILNQDLNRDDLLIFYARLLFPSTYFDCIENILLNNYNENILDKYIDNNNDYLYMLQETYYKINKKNQIMIPNWIKEVR